eukprot:6074922-Lingulodinium_polyedra.AAC.1
MVQCAAWSIGVTADSRAASMTATFLLACEDTSARASANVKTVRASVVPVSVLAVPGGPVRTKMRPPRTMSAK